jgi:ribose transport system permease protein
VSADRASKAAAGKTADRADDTTDDKNSDKTAKSTEATTEKPGAENGDAAGGGVTEEAVAEKVAMTKPANGANSVPPAEEQRRVEAAAAAAADTPPPAAARLSARLGLGGLAAAVDRLDSRLGGATRHIGLLGVLVILAVVGAITAPETFTTTSNLQTILTNAAVIGVVTVGMTFVIISGGIDLSVGAIMALASVWATTVATQSYGATVMVLCAVLVGTGTGLVNGLLIAYGRIVPFIVTLAMLAGARGLAEKLSGKQTQVVTVPEINQIADPSTNVLGIPLLVWILGAVVAAGWVLLNRTTFGRRTVAIGGNTEAARLAGINVKLHTMLLYGLSGLCCGIAAIMITAQANAGSSTHGTLYELDAIAAAIIGGTLLTGGRGTIIGSLLGVLVFAVITNLFILNNLPTEIQNIAKGAIIVGAVLLQQLRRREAG